MQGIYRIVNLVNGRWYVGSARDIEERWDSHKNLLKKGRANRHLQSDFDKYALENFRFEVLEEVRGSRDAVYDREQEYLDKWLPTGQLYNIAPLVKRPWLKGLSHTQETKEKLSIIVSAKMILWHKIHVSPWKGVVGEAHPRFGKKHTEESKRACSIAMKEWHKNHKRVEKGKPYPEFVNDVTGEVIQSGSNLTKMCREHDLDYWTMSSLKVGNTNYSLKGWRLS